MSETASIYNGEGKRIKKTVTGYYYDEFGETSQYGTLAFDNEICYTGGVYDKSTGQYYLDARYYDPANSRFLSLDTYRGENIDPRTLHLYSYSFNNPINFIDPSGHDAIWITAKKAAARAGHSAVLIHQGDDWVYWSWDDKGFEKNHNGRVFKGNWKEAIKWANNLRKKEELKKYTRFAYLKGDFKGSNNYAWKVKQGETQYNNYSLTGVNCAWMAIQLLRNGNISSKKNKKLKHLQWQKIWVVGTGRYETVKTTIVPNTVSKKVSKIFGAKYKKVAKKYI